MLTLTRLYAESANSTRRQFSRGELAMCIDVSNALYLDPLSVAESLVVDVSDTFADMPGEYEEKWDIEKDAFLAKLHALSPFASAMLQIWASAYWYDRPGEDLPDLDTYIKSPPLPESEIVRQALGLLEHALELQAATKGAFKSRHIAESVTETKKAVSLLKSLS